MRYFFLWLVNQLAVLTIIVVVLGSLALGSVVGHEHPEQLKSSTSVTLIVIGTVVAFIPAILTAQFAKKNYEDMLSSGFIRWTSAINMWESEWKFTLKTFFLGLLLYGTIVFFVGAIICAWLGIGLK